MTPAVPSLAATVPPHAAAPGSAFDITRIRAQFPILAERIHDHRLAYLDNAASSQKPRGVLDAMTRVYETAYANVHRGVHLLSQRATEAFEGARQKIARFIHASSTNEVVFVRGATEAINLVAASYGRSRLMPGDEIVLSQVEHHSNIVPWQLLAAERGLVIKVIPIGDDGALDLAAYRALLSPRTRLVAVNHVSNALGVINPVAEIIELAHAQGALALIDGCQAAPHLPIDVVALDADFYALSGHKMYGPTGIGILYGKRCLLDSMPPYQGGGEMIVTVSFEGSTFKPAPQRFEAGTPAIVEAIGLGAAVDFLDGVGLAAAHQHEQNLLEEATDRLTAIPGVRLWGTARPKVAIISFTMEGAHPHDIATVLDRAGVAVRAGHHCAQPLMARLGVSATARASFAIFNDRDDVDALIDGVQFVRRFFG